MEQMPSSSGESSPYEPEETAEQSSEQSGEQAETTPGRQGDGLDIYFSNVPSEPLLYSRRQEQSALPWPIIRSVFGRRAADRAGGDPTDRRRPSWERPRVALPEFHVDNYPVGAPDEPLETSEPLQTNPFAAPDSGQTSQP